MFYIVKSQADNIDKRQNKTKMWQWVLQQRKNQNATTFTIHTTSESWSEMKWVNKISKGILMSKVKVSESMNLEKSELQNIQNYNSWQLEVTPSENLSKVCTLIGYFCSIFWV